MNDTTTSNERPSYCGKCEEMDFTRLAQFLEHALRESPDPGSDADLPRSKEEFLDLWEILRGKYEAGITPPEPLPPDKLTSKRDRRRRLGEHVNKLRNAPSKKIKNKGREIHKAEQKIEKLNREIEEMENSGAYSDPREKPPAYIPRTLKGDPHWRTLWRSRAAIRSTFESVNDVPTTRLAWRFTESGDAGGNFPRLDEALQSQVRLVGFDQDRVDKVKLLGPKHRYKWIGGFDGYSVFTFDYTSKALMECLIKGNALFVIGSDLGEDWQKMNKQELRTHLSVTWIPHRGENWHEKVRQELGFQ